MKRFILIVSIVAGGVLISISVPGDVGKEADKKEVDTRLKGGPFVIAATRFLIKNTS